MSDHLLTGCRLATMAGPSYGLIEDAAVAISGSRIAWAGPAKDLPEAHRGAQNHDLGGRLVTPGLIDCHTHLVYGGNRAKEFEMRLEGATYEELSRAGGGILSTVKATRAASEEALTEGALPRLDALIAEGVTTVEIKSGYGLDLDTELKQLRAARSLSSRRDVRIRTTLLAAHAIPPEWKDDPDGYIALVCDDILPAAADGDLADAVDGFCEGIAFSPDQISRVFDRAKVRGLSIKLHAEQLSNLGGAAMAASYGALSADHLEYLDAEGIAAMKDAGTVAVLLPGAFYTLREEKLPPLQGLRDASVPIAIATDCNPGSSPLASILLTMNMACTLFRMTPEEALSGCTTHAATALGLGGEIGTVEAGKAADLAIWDVDEPAELAYRIGFNPLHRRIFGGKV